MCAVENLKTFDLFDTILTRRCFKPTDIFYFLDITLKEKGIITKDIDFVKIRIKAEKNARKRSTKEEVTLDEIYEYLGIMNTDLRKNLSLIKSLELQFELNSFIIIYQNYISLDNKSILISDTYFSRKFIQNLLKKYNVPYGKLYLSSEYGKTKQSGNLFSIFLEENGLTGKSITHLGDNYSSDYASARKVGLNSIYFNAAHPNRYEKLIYKNKSYTFVAKALSGAMKSARLSLPYFGNQEKTIWSTSTDVIAPFLFGYVNWIIQRAHELKLNKLYFMSRDGQILYKIAKEIIGNSKNLEIQYIYGSRKSLHYAGLTEIDDFALSWIFDSFFCSIKSISSRVGLNIEYIRVKIQEIGITDFERNLSEKERNKLKKLFTNDPLIKSQIILQASSYRDIVVKYLKQVGFTQTDRIGIVDVGWKARIQSTISRVLNVGNIYPENGIVGFYIGLVNPVSPLYKDKYEKYYNDKETTKNLQVTLIELFTSADHGMCIGYKDEGNELVPILKEHYALENWGIEVQQEAITTFTKLFLLNLKNNNYNAQLMIVKKLTKRILNKFLREPGVDEATVYGLKALFYDDQEEERALNVAKNIGKLNSYLLPFKRSTVYENGLWLSATVTLSLNHKNKISRYILFLRSINKEIYNRLIKFLK